MIRSLSIYLTVLYLWGIQSSFSQSWRQVSEINSPTDYIYNLTSVPNGDLYASVWANGVYKTSNLGANWTLSGLSNKRVSFIKAAPNGDIYSLSKTTSMSYIHRSTDNGVSWEDVYTRTFANNFAAGGGFVFPNDSTVVAAYAVTVGPTIGDVAAYVFRSTYSGSNWIQTTIVRAGFVGGMELTQDGKLLMGTSLGGVIYSTNSGSNFLNLTAFPPIYIETILVDNQQTLYVADAFDLNRSTDNGSTFTEIGSQNSDQYMTTAGVNENGELYLSMDDRKIFRSVNSGDNWTQINQGIPENMNVRTFASAGGRMFAGTGSSGVNIFDELTGITPILDIVKDYRLFQNYPNPFNPNTKISYSLPENSFVNLEVFNSLGEKLKTLINSIQQTGDHDIEFNAEGFSSGIYFYKLSSGSFVSTKRMLLIK